MRPNGFTLIEILIGIAIVGMFIAIALPQFLTIERHAAARAAAGELRSIFHLCRSRAITTGRSAGVKFTKSKSGEWQYALYDDGDGDGIRNDDIASGVDPCFQPPRRVLRESRRVFIALLPYGVVDPDGDPLPPTKSPVQFGNSTICSFSPLGNATAGTVYLSDTVSELYAVRVFAATAKMRTLRWGGKGWEER